jgi:ESS family glutamate:Na+ symporter
MTRDASRFLASDFLSLTIGIVVYFVGVLITQRVRFLRNFSIPEPVTGGFVAVVIVSLIYIVFNLQIDFDLTTRDRLLVIFFAAVGVNARLADLLAGGWTLLVLCVIASGFVFIQNIVGTAGALAFGMPPCGGGGHRFPGVVRRPWDHHCLGARHCS